MPSDDPDPSPRHPAGESRKLPAQRGEDRITDTRHDPDGFWRRPGLGAFPAFAAAYAALYASYGTVSPFLPSWFGSRGLSPEQIGYLLAAATIVKLLTMPVVGTLCDRSSRTSAVLSTFAVLSGSTAIAYLAGVGPLALVGIALLNALATAPLAPVADALAVRAAQRDGGFDYGWLRGTGSGAFVVGTLASGWIVGQAGLNSIQISSGVLFLLLALLAIRLPTAHAATARAHEGWRDLLCEPTFLRITAIAGLVIGSHAMNDAFSVIHWRAAGLSPFTTGALWSLSVASEVLVFMLAGPALLARIGPARCLMVSAVAGIARWTTLAMTTAVPVLACAQLMHGLTFALLHLANMRVIAAIVPEERAATAQTLYATIGMGMASTVLTAISGTLYDRLGGAAFLAMTALSAAALPIAVGMSRLSLR